MKEARLLLEQILESISYIELYVSTISREAFLESTQVQDAVIRRLEIIGEAVKRLAPSVRDRYPDIQWRQIAGMRDVLIHHYFDVDLELTWNVVREDLQVFKQKPLQILDELN